ncbi:hypothetical protein OPV22_007308 [Ensete ventricosum]|uniref:Uncharacterized protein n=2 Tax=Ensete ventricosum TaxID=4639 RepID=A0AAV8QE47_ENSVE|nr:hypothetical protein OPV22_007308 [Ensete ventricosum]
MQEFSNLPTMAEERESSASHPRQREKQQITVPYLWEEKPGVPKRVPVISSSSPPTRLVVSVPFEWEEKPGKPIQIPTTVPDSLTAGDLNALDPLPASSCHLNPFVDETEGGAMDSCLEAFSFTMDDKGNQSFADVTAAWESFSENGSYWNEDWHSASGTDGHSSSGSSAAAEVGADTSVIQFLFPQPSGEDEAPSTVAARRGPNHCSSEHVAMARRTLTLGELMLLSRKLSCRRKQNEGKKRDHPKEYLKKRVLTCFPFIANGNKQGEEKHEAKPTLPKLMTTLERIQETTERDSNVN